MGLRGHAPEPGRSAFAETITSEMGKKTTKVMEGKSQQERKKVRSKLGSLKGLTVQPRTRERYTDCLNRFFDWLAGSGKTSSMAWSVTTLNICGPQVRENRLPTTLWQLFRTVIRLLSESSLPVGGC